MTWGPTEGTNTRPTRLIIVPSHRPKPGPLHWDWRCMVCGGDVKDHPSWLRRLLTRVSRRFGR